VAKQNLTLTVDADLLRAARKVAIDRNTSVNQLVRDYLEQLVGEKERRQKAAEELHRFFQTSRYKVGKITWKRDDLHERW